MSRNPSQRDIGGRFRNPIIIDDNDSDESDDTPITRRASSDETDTESVATDFTEDTVTDNGEEHPSDHQARELRTWQANSRMSNTIERLDKTLQYTNDGMINGFQSVHRGLDYLYNDITLLAYREMEVQLHAAAILSVRALVYSVTHIVDLLRILFGRLSQMMPWLWRVGVNSAVSLGRNTLDFFHELYIILDLLVRFLWMWGVDYVIMFRAYSKNRIRVAYAHLDIFIRLLLHWLWQVGVDSTAVLGRIRRTCTGVLYDCLVMFLQWLDRDGWKLAIFCGIASLISISILKGWLGMSLYVCDNPAYNNTGLLTRGSLLQTTCELNNVSKTIQIVNSELAALLDASDTVIHTTDDMAHPAFIDMYHPSRDLIRNISQLKEFAEMHQLSDPTISPEDTGALATIPPLETLTVFEEMYQHAWAIRNNSEIVKHELEIRYDELNVRLNGIQEYSKKNETQSAVRLFFSEVFSYLLPSSFTLTHTHRQASDYAKVSQQILEDRLTLSLLNKTSTIAQRINKISALMVIVRDYLHDFQDDWVEACREWKEEHGDDATYDGVMHGARHIVGGDTIFKLLDGLLRCEKGP
jgi:hypothetical protein